MFSGVDFVIIFEKEISEYYTQPFEDMYRDLVSIKKDHYTNEQIIITSFGWTNKNIWRHFFRIINSIDIPTYFIKVKTNNPDTIRIVREQCSKCVPQDNPIECNIVLKPLHSKSYINNRFDIHDAMCINPFTNLEVTVNGNITVCCEIDRSYYGTDLLPKPVNIKDVTIAEAKNSDHVKKIQQDFLQGRATPYCNYCWNNEAVGFPSKRQRDEYFFRDIIYTTDFHNANKIQTLDLKMGFTCNLKCRICSHQLSSSWYSEDKRYENVPSIKTLDYGYTLSRKMWADVVDKLPDLRYINYAGGEPLLDKTHLAKLERLIELDRTNVHIHYNTNGTVYSERHIELLEQFDTVSITFSIDNTEERFEYERHGSNWNTVLETLNKYSKLDRSRFILEFFPTVNIFNVMYLDSVIDLCDQLGFEYAFGFVDNPKYFSLCNIPPESRNTITKRLRSSKHAKIQNLANRFEEQDIYHDMQEELWNEITRIDLRRNENFCATYPELSKLLNIPVSQF